jgi:hypothetical protein
MRKLSRRQFVRLVLGGLAASALDNCAPGTLPPTPTPLPEATRPATPVPTPIPHLPLLRNDNVPGFYVRYYKPFPAVDAEQ